MGGLLQQERGRAGARDGVFAIEAGDLESKADVCNSLSSMVVEERDGERRAPLSPLIFRGWRGRMRRGAMERREGK